MAVSRINEAGLNINQYGNRNIVINGAMKVAQRSTSETGLGGADGYFTVDRFKIDQATASAGRFTMSQETITDLPGFANCIKLDCTTADTSVAAGERLLLRYIIEGQDLQQLKKGTSDAETFTVSFYVKGDAAATYSLSLYDADNARMISQTFSVTTSWNRIELTFAGDTTGTFDDDNNSSLMLDIFLHAGTDYTSGTLQTSWGSNLNANRAVGITSFFDSTDREFFITGYQLEVGDTATDFEHRTFGDELARCQRYYYRMKPINPSGGVAHAGAFNTHARTSTELYGVVHLPTSMRTTPSIAISATGDMNAYHAAISLTVSSFAINGMSTAASAEINVTVNSGATAGYAGWIRINKAAGYIEFDSEL